MTTKAQARKNQKKAVKNYMKDIEVRGRMIIDFDTIINVEDDLKGSALNKHIFRACREAVKDCVYDAPITINSIKYEGYEEDMEAELDEILNSI
jgi:hypothetical protein